MLCYEYASQRGSPVDMPVIMLCVMWRNDKHPSVSLSAVPFVRFQCGFHILLDPVVKTQKYQNLYCYKLNLESSLARNSERAFHLRLNT